jgi:serine/threonine-protein kinase RsbW
MPQHRRAVPGMPPDPVRATAMTDCAAEPGADDDDGDAFRIVAHANPETVRDVLHLTLDHFGTRMPGPEVAALQIVLAEVLNNIAEHAYAGLPHGLVSVAIWSDPEGLRCRVEDQGQPMPGGTLPPGDLPSLDVDTADLPDGGFGWHMIRSLTADLTYARIGGTNRLEFRLPRRHH